MTDNSIRWKKPTLLLLLILVTLIAWGGKRQGQTGREMAVRMAESEMKHFPEPWGVDFNPKPTWSYTQGLIAMAMMQVWETTGNDLYYQYAKAYADKMIEVDGKITGYKMEEYNIDRVNSGKFLFDLYRRTGDERYRKAILILREQMKTHPRTSEGGFWHKNVYPHQMWLDGLYMGSPFLARFAREYEEASLIDDVINQFAVVNRHTFHQEIQLNYHGWDESRQQKWADPVTGCSPNFWGRAMGWYAMALTDVLDFIPENHPRRSEIIGILRQVASGIKKHQDKESGLWYQVMDQGNREGNYLEATSSSMFVYALAKASRLKLIDRQYAKVALKGYKGILKHLIRENENGTISLTNCCSVAGLGGNPYRDGSYEYYVGEPVRDNDPKGVGPFIIASLEMDKAAGKK